MAIDQDGRSQPDDRRPIAGARFTTLIGTSGWAYDSWRHVFYPDEIPRSRWLAYYASEFPVVEINATFYRLATRRAVGRWIDAVPGDFVFVVKGSRFLTHTRKLSRVGTGMRRFFEPLRELGPQLDAVLWQLPPWLPMDRRLLADFLDTAAAHAWDGVQHAVEFRHPSWLVDDTFDLLDRRHAMTVVASGGALTSEMAHAADTITGGRAYLRFHGLEGRAAHDYSDRELRPWAERLSAHPAALVFFNNDVNGRAVNGARRLRRLVAAATDVVTS